MGRMRLRQESEEGPGELMIAMPKPYPFATTTSWSLRTVPVLYDGMVTG